ncbi:mechanosensitive ion channel family protein [Aquiflexum gelatinilyticum]|uniref:mechanosensitive ion channel family protein n=1 Tax=Aquiflexum gelatinilyticum TaxID=2961943 RepID=UPI00216813EA|nr:mechanosensitive ion channel domain-containing protein [Aquiflexum gelatinilyticum]MCS4435062.1 mechanosensitive ion channel [Aquiflexum gelatinilyticum]
MGYKIFFLFAFVFLTSHFGFAQEIPVVSSIDSLLELNLEEQMKEVVVDKKPSLEGSIKKVQQYTTTLNGMNQVLKKELDTTEIMQIVPNAQGVLDRITETLSPENTKINLRYLTALENLLAYNERKIRDKDKVIYDRMEELVGLKEKMDSIQNDDLLKYSFRDTTMLVEYQVSIKSLKTLVHETDSLLNSQRILTAVIQSRVSTILNDIDLRVEDLRQARIQLERTLFEKENNYIWEPKDFPNTDRLVDIFFDALRINRWIIGNYLSRNIPLTLFLFGLVYLLYFYINSNIKKITLEKEFSGIIFGRLKYLNKHPFLAALVVVLAVSPFFYPYPPAVFFALLMFILVTIATILLRSRLSSKAYRLWLLVYFLFFISVISNLYWEVAYQERWHLILFNFLGIILGWKMIKLQQKKEENLPSYIKTIVIIYMIFESVSFLTNIFGRFSLSKMIGIVGSISLLHAVSLIIFVIILKEIIYIQIEVSKKNGDGFTSAVAFYDIQKRVNKFFTYLAIIIWGYYFLESLHLLDTFLEMVFNFFDKPRQILNASFTYSQIAVFILIIYLSSFLANTIGYFASIKDEQHGNERSKRLGSSILLIKLAVFTLGFLIAIAASGIPIDKITIILGALSVGIGFGLQTIVNNLVSGIILAFERPIQIGDTIQVGTVEGVVKDIGIRASKIRNWDGAEVIIPNGDLLAHHLTNWTLSDKSRRVELTIGVAYNSDMDLVTALIQKQLEVDEIMNLPAPKVFLQTFGDNSVNFRVLFWVNDVDIWVLIRDQVMRGIFKSFKEYGIEIPFPQRDLYVKSFPGLIGEKVMKPGEISPEEKPKGKSDSDPK